MARTTMHHGLHLFFGLSSTMLSKILNKRVLSSPCCSHNIFFEFLADFIHLGGIFDVFNVFINFLYL